MYNSCTQNTSNVSYKKYPDVSGADISVRIQDGIRQSTKPTLDPVTVRAAQRRRYTVCRGLPVSYCILVQVLRE